jgi:DNA repair photolyase
MNVGYSLRARLKAFNKNSKVLKQFRSGFKSSPCPLRLVVNIYVGCQLGCIYCYARCYIKNFDGPRCKANFERALESDIEKAIEMGLRELLVSVSNSTEPFQALEEEHKHALYALRRLVENGFRIIILTKNPTKLLERPYLDAMDPKKVIIEVTVPFLDGRYFEPFAPSSKERIDAAGELAEAGFTVTIRIDPIIPRFGNVPGQTEEDIRTLTRFLAEKGIKYVISKGLRLPVRENVTKLFPDFCYGLLPYYKCHGRKVGWFYVLRGDAEEKLLKPVYESCEEFGLKLSTCMACVRFRNSRFCDQSEVKFGGGW